MKGRHPKSSCGTVTSVKDPSSVYVRFDSVMDSLYVRFIDGKSELQSDKTAECGDDIWITVDGEGCPKFLSSSAAMFARTTEELNLLKELVGTNVYTALESAVAGGFDIDGEVPVAPGTLASIATLWAPHLSDYLESIEAIRRALEHAVAREQDAEEVDRIEEAVARMLDAADAILRSVTLQPQVAGARDNANGNKELSFTLDDGISQRAGVTHTIAAEVADATITLTCSQAARGVPVRLAVVGEDPATEPVRFTTNEFGQGTAVLTIPTNAQIPASGPVLRFYVIDEQ